MKKHDLKKLALMGLTGGVLLSAQSINAEETPSENAVASVTADHKCGSGSSCNHQRGGSGGGAGCQQHKPKPQTQQRRELTERELIEHLNDEGKQVYNALTPEGKALALRLASRSCGAGSCGGAYTNKNVAVNEAARQMADKRAKTSGQY